MHSGNDKQSSGEFSLCYKIYLLPLFIFLFFLLSSFLSTLYSVLSCWILLSFSWNSLSTYFTMAQERATPYGVPHTLSRSFFLSLFSRLD